MEPFKALPSRSPTGLKRLLCSQPKENAFVEIINLLDKAQRMQDVTVEGVQVVARALSI